MSILKPALEASGLSIRNYTPDKVKSIHTSTGPVTTEKFSILLLKALGEKIINFPDVLKAAHNSNKMEKLVEDYVMAEFPPEPTEETIPADLAPYTLNMDTTKGEYGAKRFFLTTADEFIVPHITGHTYMLRCNLTPAKTAARARMVVPKFMPRMPTGIHSVIDEITQVKTDYFNTYVPSALMLWKERNKTEWDNLPKNPPDLILRMIKHIIPDQKEQEYFYGWVYTSITKRAYVFLVLCGIPGVGKNTLLLLLRALHGHWNTSAGKKETFGANQSKFNSQMENKTLMCCDELKFSPEMEARMKESQNDFIPIEKKGVDATHSSEIHCSMAVSNNYLRDNYIPPGSRKYAPLVLGDSTLDTSLSSKEIGILTGKFNDEKQDFDVKFVAQFAKWILEIGPKCAAKFPNLEYRGPMFWRLVHSSMSHWQKTAVQKTTTLDRRGPYTGWDKDKKGFLWSKLEKKLRADKEIEPRDYRDSATVQAFFGAYCDIDGKKIFEVEEIPSNTFHDFWIIPLEALKPYEKPSVAAKYEQNTMPKLEREPGLSNYQWRQKKEEFEVKTLRQMIAADLPCPDGILRSKWDMLKKEFDKGETDYEPKDTDLL